MSAPITAPEALDLLARRVDGETVNVKTYVDRDDDGALVLTAWHVGGAAPARFRLHPDALVPVPLAEEDSL